MTKMLYEYECTNCNKKLELQASVEDRDNQYCPDCGCLLQRLVSKSTFILKGVCWSKDGYIRKETRDDYYKKAKHEAKFR